MRLLLFFSTLIFSSIAHAGFAVKGRLADLSHLPQRAVEAKVELGTGNGDFTTLELGYNYKVSNELLFTGSVGRVEADSNDGTLIGISGHRVLEGIVENYDLAVVFSFSRLSADDTASIFDLGAVISSPEPFGKNKNLYWYGNLFLSRVSNGSSDTEIGIGGGVVMPSSGGEFFLGADLLDEVIIGVGYRHFLK